MQKGKRFNKKQAVRFVLIPGRDEHGNPTTMFKPVETRNRLSKAERNKIINQISDYQIQIDGKAVDQSELPAFVLQQIKGRADLIFNQKNPDMFDMRGHEQEHMHEAEDIEDWDDEEGELIPEEQYMGEEYGMEVSEDRKKVKQQQIMEKYGQKTGTETKEVIVDGEKYQLTEQQIAMLDQVLPENYQNYRIKGVQFVKYDEFGIRIDQKQTEAYKKYTAQPVERRAIIDSFDYLPEKPVDIVDDDLQGQKLKGDLKDLDDALNFEGQEDAYQQLEDDFFAKLIAREGQQDEKQKQSRNSALGEGFKKKKERQLQKNQQIDRQMSAMQRKNQQISKKQAQKNEKSVPKNKQQHKPSNLDDIDGEEEEQIEDEGDDEDYYEDEKEDNYEQQQITDQMIEEAIIEFDSKTKSIKPNNLDQEQRQEIKRIAGTGIPITMKGMDLINFIQQREGCTGKDGELDWRTLTKKEKREYMKNKKIREAFDQIREREISEKLNGKQNIKAEQLHLKQYIKHIPYEQDHVMQQAIKRDQQQVVDIYADAEEDYQTDSDQDDIVSYRAKTSIISSNLAVVEDGGNKKKNPKPNHQGDSEEDKQHTNIQKIKVVPQKRNRNETAEQRKERKEKLKEMKKQKKQQKKQFSQLFEGERRKVLKKTNHNNNNPLHKVSYVKIV